MDVLDFFVTRMLRDHGLLTNECSSALGMNDMMPGTETDKVYVITTTKSHVEHTYTHISTGAREQAQNGVRTSYSYSVGPGITRSSSMGLDHGDDRW